MVSAPIMMLVYDRVYLSDSFAELFRRRWGLYLGLVGTWLLLGVLFASSRAEDSAGLTGSLTPWRYATAQFGVIVHYLRLSVWPHPLVFDYAWRLPDSVDSVVPWAAAVGALVGGTVLAFRRLPWVGFWGAWFFLILAPTSSILPIADLAFEHRMYLPLAAVALLAVIGGHEVLGLVLHRLAAPRDLRRWLEVGLVVVGVVMLGSATVRRNEDYRSDLAMWSDTVAKRPDNPRAHNNLAIALDKRGKIDEAIGHFAEAVRLKGNYADAHINLGFALVRQGRNKEAIPYYTQAVRLKPDSPNEHNNLGVALYRDGQINDAIAQFSQAALLKPAFPEAHYNIGLAFAKQG